MLIFTKLKNIFLAWRKEKRLQKLKIYFPVYCKLYRVSSVERQGALAQSRAGDKLQVVHTPCPNAPYNVYVYSITLNRVLGCLQEEFSKKLVSALGENFCRDAVIENITGGAPMYELRGCNLCIFDTMEYMDNEVDFQSLHEV